MLKEISYQNPLETTVKVKDDDYAELKKLAGHSYRMTTLDERGVVPFVKGMKHNIVTIIGAFLLGALIFYQGLFVGEIRVDGYVSLTEAEVRQTLKKAGLYEGVRKPGSYDHIETALYENHRPITWVSIYEDGKLIKVNIAEAGKAKEAEPEDKTPVNIVASRSAMIEKVLPLQGNAMVQKGDYVNEGDVLISGNFEYQSTDYSRGDEFFNMYSHAKGQALARVPRQVCFYMQKSQRSEKLTGKVMPGIHLRVGDIIIDTVKPFYHYACSVRNEKNILNITKPLPFEFSLVTVAESNITYEKMDKDKRSTVVEAMIRQYEREKLKDGEEIAAYEIDYTETKNLIKATVFMEVLEDIGKEKEIKVKKEEKEEEKTN